MPNIESVNKHINAHFSSEGTFRRRHKKKVETGEMVVGERVQNIQKYIKILNIYAGNVYGIFAIAAQAYAQITGDKKKRNCDFFRKILIREFLAIETVERLELFIEKADFQKIIADTKQIYATVTELDELYKIYEECCVYYGKDIVVCATVRRLGLEGFSGWGYPTVEKWFDNLQTRKKPQEIRRKTYAAIRNAILSAGECKLPFKYSRARLEENPNIQKLESLYYSALVNVCDDDEILFNRMLTHVASCMKLGYAHNSVSHTVKYFDICALKNTVFIPVLAAIIECGSVAKVEKKFEWSSGSKIKHSE